MAARQFEAENTLGGGEQANRGPMREHG